MADPLDTNFDRLPLEVKRRIDGVCARFEAAWRRGDAPSLEGFLPEVGPADRPFLLQELLLVELEYRRRAGQQPTAADYLKRLPGFEALVRLILPARHGDETPGDAAATQPGIVPGKTVLQVPGYEILEELGRGGMGIVYKARDVTLNRLVALKFILAGTTAPGKQRVRFRREAEAVARLHHPNIVQIYAFGEVEGQVYFALEYADAGSVRDRLAGAPMDPHAAAKLLEPVARAVQHAHRQGVIHRDLKPANILLASGGDSIGLGQPLPAHRPAPLNLPGVVPPPPLASCTPKLTDFGLARLTDREGSKSEMGFAAGTPQYMAPEQAMCTPGAGASIDVWALGATLYELLTGRPPFRAATGRETVRLMLDTDPVPPTLLNPEVPRDLETICLKCLEKDPARRYPGARELAQDLRAFLDGAAIAAKPVGRVERWRKWARRHPWLAAAWLVVAAVAAVGLGLLLAGLVLAVAAWREADRKERSARQQSQAAVEERDQAVTSRRAAEKQAATLLYEQAQDYGRRGEVERAVENLRAALELVQDKERDLEWAVRRSLAGWKEHAHPLDQTVPLPDGVFAYAVGPEGRVAFASAAGEVTEYDPLWKSGDVVYKAKAAVRLLAWMPEDGGLLVVAGDAARVVPRGGGVPVALPHPAAVRDAAVTPTGKLIVTASGGVVRRWTPTGLALDPPLEHPAAVERVAVSADGAAVAAAVAGGQVWLWDLKAERPTSQVLPRSHTALSLAFHPDGRRLLTGHADGHARLWVNGVEQPNEFEHPEPVTQVAWLPDGLEAMTAAGDHVVRLWDVPARKATGVFRGATLPAALRADGRQLVVPVGRELRYHTLARPRSRLHPFPRREGPPRGGVTSVAASVTGRLLYGEDFDLRAHGLAWLHDGTRVRQLRHRLPKVTRVAMTWDGTIAATVARDGRMSSIQWWNPSTGDLIRGPVFVPVAVETLEILADGSTVARDDRGFERTWENFGRRPQEPGGQGASFLIPITPPIVAGRTLAWEHESLNGDTVETLTGGGILRTWKPYQPTTTAVWHAARAIDAWILDDLFAARWHLDRLVKAAPTERTHLLRRAAVLARQGRFDDAQRDLRAASGGAKDVLINDLEVGLAWSQAAGDRGAIRWYLGHLARQLPGEAWVADERAVVDR